MSDQIDVEIPPVSKKTFQKRYYPLVAFLGPLICAWYLVTMPFSEIRLYPALALAAAITILEVFALPSNALSHAVVLGGVMIYGPLTTSAAVVAGVILAFVVKRLTGMEKSLMRCCLEVGILVIPMTLAWETLNWQPEVLTGYYFGREWYSSIVSFVLIFSVVHAAFTLADMLWKEPQLQEAKTGQAFGWVWSELAAWPLVVLFAWQYPFNGERALFLLAALPVVITLLWYILVHTKAKSGALEVDPLPVEGEPPSQNADE